MSRDSWFCMLHALYADSVASMRVAVYDGISGPCLGCLSNVHTGYTGGVMGLPGETQGAPLAIMLANVIQDLLTASASSGPSLIGDGRYPLPGLQDLAEYLVGNGKTRCRVRRISVDPALREQLSKALAEAGCKAAKEVSDAVLAALLLRAEVYYPDGTLCDALIKGEVRRAELLGEPPRENKNSVWDVLQLYAVEYMVLPR